MKISGTLNYRVLKGMALITAQGDDHRPTLGCVQVRRVNHETYWLATDGRRAGILKDEGGLIIESEIPASGVFELPVPKFALFGLRDKNGRDTLRFDMDTEAVPEHKKESEYVRGEVTVPVSGWCDWSANGITQRILMPKLSPYPNIMQVVPDLPFTLAESFSFNPGFVADALKVVNMALGIKCGSVSVFQYKPNPSDQFCHLPLFVRVSDQFYYVLMPMRDDNARRESYLPDWLKNLRTAPVAPPAPVVVQDPDGASHAGTASPETPEHPNPVA